MMTKFFCAFVALMLVATLSQAQDYKSAVGLRFGAPLSVSYKTFVSDRAHLKVWRDSEVILDILGLILVHIINYTMKFLLLTV
ncbi:MAG: hypothetical protein IPO26_13325 [Saprospiraceae bacterium]|nr:hypothetical protein [Saprospiraceae bacterium]